MEQQVIQHENEGIAGLLYDIERYYQDHMFTLELMWPREARGEVAEILVNHMAIVPPGTEFVGTVIPSIDTDALYVRVKNGAKFPDLRQISFLAHRVPIDQIEGPFKDLVYSGVFARVGWAFLRKIWAELDVKVSHYELSREMLRPLVRRARFKALLDFVIEVVLTEVASCLKGYNHSKEIGTIFVKLLLEDLLDVVHPDETRGLQDLEKRLDEALSLAEDIGYYGRECLEN